MAIMPVPKNGASRWRLPVLVTKAPAMMKVYEEVDRLAATELSVLILGETGSGKDVLARLIHEKSHRSAGPFVAVNCATFPKDLVQAELFGVEAKVATGVERRPGKIELANGGTLFLDEISDMSPVAQASVLRVLEDHELWRIGSRSPISVSLRVIAASNCCRGGEATISLRTDLYWRLAGYVIELPPLRERRCDIPMLAKHFVSEAAARNGGNWPRLTQDALDLLIRYHWPGNIRQLRQEMERAVAMTGPASFIEAPVLSCRVRSHDPDPKQPCDLRGTVRELERKTIARALLDTGNDVDIAAHVLGVSVSTLYRKMRKLGLRPKNNE